MIHKDLCKASFIKHHTVLRIQFNFLLATVHTWEGEIPLTAHELAEKLNCHVDTMRRLIAEALYDGVLRREGDKLFFTKCVNPREGYVKHFPFLDSLEFRQEDIQVVRFVLEVLSTGAYSKGFIFHAKMVDLYHRLNKKKEIIKEGRFNIYFPAKLKEVMEKAKKYLIFANSPEQVVRIVGLRPEWDQEPVKNRGEQFAVLKILKRFGLGDVAQPVLEELVKVKGHYKKHLGVEMAKSIANEALLRALSKEEGKFASLLLSNESREIGAYFRRVCEEVEQEIAAKLVQQKEQFKRALQFFQLFMQRKIRFAGQFLVSKVKEHLQRLQGQIQRYEEYWMQLAIQLSQVPKRQHQYLACRENHPLFKSSPLLRKCIDATRDQKERVVFPFYNWLEEN